MPGLAGLIGRTLGQYHIVEQIGEGGMATVFKAYQASLDRYVAVKILPPLYADQPGFNERFVREARAIARLHHPNILPIHDFGQEQGYSFIVMRYVEGACTLRELMTHPLDSARVVNLIGQIAAALDHAHARQIIHRDVKPSNVLMDGDWALLSDFGLAKMVEASSQLTGTGVGIGTPAYMSPEQGQALPVDHRTDIYALGIILFEMLTGQIPHHAETPFAIILKRLNEPLPLPRSLNPAISVAAERVILKALAREPGDRFESAGALAGALRDAVAPVPVEVKITPTVTEGRDTSPTSADIPAATAAESPAPVVEETVISKVALKPKRKLALPLVSVIVVFLLLAVVGGVVLYNYNGEQPSPTLPAAIISPSHTPTISPTLIVAAIPPSPTPTTTPIPPTPTDTPIPPTNTPPPPTATAKPMRTYTYKDMVVGFIQMGSEGNWRAANTASFKETADQLGIRLKFYDGQNNLENQFSAFKSLIADNEVNAIVLVALETSGWDNLLQEAGAAGKIVVLEDRPIDAPKNLYATYISSDFVEEGRKAAVEMCALLKDSPKKNVVELVGTVGSSAAEGRGQGFHEKMGNCGITITQSDTANFVDTQGKQVMQAFLNKDRDIQGVFAQNDAMGLGAIQAIKEAGLKPGTDIKIISIDADASAFNAMAAGELNVTVECNPLLAPQVYEAALKALNGEELPKWIPSQEGVFYAKDAAAILPTRKY